MKLVKHCFLALALLELSGLVAGCGRNAAPSASRPTAADQNVAVLGKATAPAAATSGVPAGSVSEVQSAIAAAQAAARTQNYSNAVQRFDAIRSSGNLTGDQLTQIQDAEARMMRELAAKAVAGDKNALRQFQEIANRPRRGVQH